MPTLRFSRLTKFAVFGALALWLGQLSAQTTLYWSGAALDPAKGGDGVWNGTQHWSSSSGSYLASQWIGGADVVLGGANSGIISAGSGGVWGGTLTVQRNVTIDTAGQDLVFGSLGFSGAGSNLTLTGGGSFSAGISSGTVTLAGTGTSLKIGSVGSLLGGTVVLRDTTSLAVTGRTWLVGSAVVQMQDSAAIRLQGGNLTVERIESLTPGAGVIENAGGVRASVLTVNQVSGSVTYSGELRDSASGPQTFANLRLRKQGAGTLVLAGARKTHTGGTVVAEGTLRMGAAHVLPQEGTVAVVGGALDLAGFDQSVATVAGDAFGSAGEVLLGAGTLTLAGGDTMTEFRGTISGPGALVKSGVGYQKLSGDNPYAGGTTIAAGTLAVGHVNALGSGPLVVKDGATLAIATLSPFAKNVTFESGETVVTLGPSVYTATLPGSFAGAATVHYKVTSGGEFIVSGVNRYSGGTKVTKAKLTISSDDALGSGEGSLVLDNATLAWVGTFNLSASRAITLTGANVLALNGRNTTIAQNISGAGSLSIGAAGTNGTVTLGGTNTFTDGLQIAYATVEVNGDAALGVVTSPVTIRTAGALRFARSTNVPASRSIKVEGFQPSIDVSDGAKVSLAAPLVGGSGEVTTFLKRGAGLLDLAAVATLNGPTTVLAGTLRLSGGDNVLPTDRGLTVAEGGVIDLAGRSQVLATLSGGGTVALGGGTLVVTGSSNFSGRLGGGGIVRTPGGGFYSIGDSPDFSGHFQLEAGVLWTSGALGPTSTVTLSGKTSLHGMGSLGKLEMESGSMISPGYYGAQLISLESGRVKSGTSFQCEIAGAAEAGVFVSDRIRVAGEFRIEASENAPFVIELRSRANADLPGPVGGFNPAVSFQLPLVSADGGIVGFSPTKVRLDLSGFTNRFSGSFRLEVSESGKDLVLVYAGGPRIVKQPQSVAVRPGDPAELSVVAEGPGPLSYKWYRDGVAVSGGEEAKLVFTKTGGNEVGRYRVRITNANGEVLSAVASVALDILEKSAGDVTEVGADIVHPNGNIYDQFQMTGPLGMMRADPGQVVRVSFIDLNDDIVQVEFSGAGTLTVALEGVSGPAKPAKYNQDVSYVRGHARLTLAGADQTTNLSVFSVGRMTAVNQGLFRANEIYDGMADLASVHLLATSGRFGGLRTANGSYFATSGITGVDAPGVTFAGPVYLGELSAEDAAEPVIMLGQVAAVHVTGGNCNQGNGRSVEVGGFGVLRFVDGQDSHGRLQPAQQNRARLIRDDVDVTRQVVVNPGL